MGNRAKDKLRWLLKRYELPTPPQKFTGEVIAEIEAMANEKVVASERLKYVLKNDVLTLPSASFTYKVVNKVREQSNLSIKPVISKKVWGLIGGFVMVCLGVAFIMEPSEQQSSDTPYTIPIAEYLTNLTLTFKEPLFYLAGVVASAAVLLWIDHIFRRAIGR